jgi:hypothetical protein
MSQIASARALAFFKPKQPGVRFRRNEAPDTFDRIAFVLKARLKENRERPWTSVLHVEQMRTGSRLVATDGKRMHVALIGTRIKSGNYKPVVTKDTISLGEPVAGILFPAWNRVIPENPRKRGTVNLSRTGMGKDKELTAALSAAFKTLIAKTGEVINLGYLEDLPKTGWDLYKEPGKLKAVMLKQRNVKDAFAVIVPMTIAA